MLRFAIAFTSKCFCNHKIVKNKIICIFTQPMSWKILLLIYQKFVESISTINTPLMAVSDIELNNLILYVAQISVVGGEIFFFFFEHIIVKINMYL